MKVLLLAGGTGTRLWPLSRKRYPKQFIKLFNAETSLFQEAFNRSALLTDVKDIFIVTNENYKFLIIDQIEELGFDYDNDNILVEPEGKNTLPAISYGTFETCKKEIDTVVVFPTDHKVKDEQILINTIKESEILAQNYIITFGIRPTEPKTGYGYIEPGQKMFNGYEVKQFKEKPNKDLAKEYIQKGFLWNSGIFMFNHKVFFEELKINATDIYEAFNTSNDVKESFTKINEDISIDYGVMEKTNKAAVVPIDLEWNDLGSFDAFDEVFEKDDNNNILNNDNLLLDSRNNVIITEENKEVVVVGVEDVIVVDKEDALLVCKKNKSQKIRDVVSILKSKNKLVTEYNLQDYRPWGYYKVLDEADSKFKIKRIVVYPGKKLSKQMHYHRSEHWIVIKGTAKVTVGTKEKLLSVGNSVFIKTGTVHRLENPGNIPLEIVEVQLGEYLEEHDIVRFQDDYARV